MKGSDSHMAPACYQRISGICIRLAMLMMLLLMNVNIGFCDERKTEPAEKRDEVVKKGEDERRDEAAKKGESEKREEAGKAIETVKSENAERINNIGIGT